MRFPIAVLLLATLGAACGAPAPAPAPRPSAAAAVTPPPSPSPLPDPVPEVVARVNDRAIPLRHLRLLADEQLRGRTATPGDKALAYRRAAEQLVSRELMLQEARRRGIVPDAAAVTKMYEAFRAGYPSDAAWKAWLVERSLDEKEFRDELAVRHTVEALRRAVAAEVPEAVAEEDARAYFDANRGVFDVAGQASTFDEARPRVEAQLRAFRREEALDALVRRLRAEARIEMFL